MRKNVTMEFECGDVELIKSCPPSPCHNKHCRDCCGCPEHREWDTRYGSELTARGIKDYAQLYWDYMESVKAAERALLNRDALKKKLIDAGVLNSNESIKSMSAFATDNRESNTTRRVGVPVKIEGMGWGANRDQVMPGSEDIPR